MTRREMILQDVSNLNEEDRTLIGQAVSNNSDGEHAVPTLETIGFFRVAYVRECLVRAREAGFGYSDKLAALGRRLLAALKTRPGP